MAGALWLRAERSGDLPKVTIKPGSKNGDFSPALHNAWAISIPLPSHPSQQTSSSSHSKLSLGTEAHQLMLTTKGKNDQVEHEKEMQNLSHRN